MKKTLLAGGLGLFLVMGLGGCVTEQYVNGSDRAVESPEKDPKQAAMVRLQLALQYLKLDKTAQAKLNLDRAAALAPDMEGIQASYAYYFQRVGELDKAEKAYHKAVRKFPDNANLRNNFGAFLCDQKRFDEAEKQFVEAINTEGNVQMASSYENAGLCALRAKDYTQAKKYLKVVLQYESYRAKSLLGMAEAEFNTSGFAAVRGYLTRYSGVYRPSPQSLWLHIRLENELKNYSSVEKYGKLLLSQFPDSSQALSYQAKRFK